MSVLSGKVEEYENVAYDGFDENAPPSPAFLPFQNGDEQSTCNHKTQITPEIPTITLDDDEEEEVVNGEDDVAITNVVENKLPDLLGVTGISEQTADANQNLHNVGDEIIGDKIKGIDTLNISTGGGDSITTTCAAHNHHSTQNLQLDTKHISKRNTLSTAGTEVCKKLSEDTAVDSDSEYRRSYNKKCQELIQQQCWRKRKKKRRRMKRMEERQSGIIVISSDENDSEDDLDYTSSTDDTDFRQTPCKLARLPRKGLESPHHHPSTALHAGDTPLNGTTHKSSGNPQDDQVKDLLEEEDINDSSGSLSSTDLTSDLSHQDGVEGGGGGKDGNVEGAVKDCNKEDDGGGGGGGGVAVSLCGDGASVDARDDCNGDITNNGSK